MSDSPAPSSLMRIGEVAARTELSLRSLRHWEDVGLLRPSGRSEGGFRLYTEEDVEKIVLIRRMKPLGFTLEEMRAALTDSELLRDATADPQAREQARLRLRAVHDDALERRERLTRQVAMADEFLHLLGEQLDPRSTPPTPDP